MGRKLDFVVGKGNCMGFFSWVMYLFALACNPEMKGIMVNFILTFLFNAVSRIPHQYME